ncbi:uncharacterized protein LOC119725387 [Patiria miniata]|uniref:G-protein coupled receptor GRL101 n=1 Tax=Patiria miniata TaxID=46514 RepID=A0A913ZNU8_PATMI|nr:uncharacterized protein LOC119725387 [Patiria miniata]
MAQGLFVLVVESQIVYDCHDVSLTEANQKVSISTHGWNSTDIDSGPSILTFFCWNLTTQNERQFRATCQYQLTEPDSYFFSLYLNFGNIFSSFDWFPREFEATGPQLTISVALADPFASMACRIQSVPDTGDSLCGPGNINLTDEYLLNISEPANRLFKECVWLVTSDPDKTIFIDVLRLDLHHYSQRLAFGRGHDPTNDSSQFLAIDSTIYQPIIGTTFFLTGETRLWITFSSSLHDDNGNDPATQELLLRAENYTGEVHCRSGQILCRKDSKCLPLHTFCDGKKHCSDFVDEAGTCDRCGISDISLRFGQPITILADFEGFPASDDYYAWDIDYTGHFAIYPGESETIPNDTSSGDVIVSNYTGVDSQLECVWMLTEPQGTRIKVRVAEFEGPGLIIKLGNGLDPSGVPGVVLDASDGFIPLPLEVPSIDSGVWITLEESYKGSFRFSFKLRLVFTTYNITECDEGHYPCPSGLDCLDNVSHICDGHKECPAYGDELGCDECRRWEFKCALTKACVPGYKLCDGNADCEDHSDEVMCGFCGNETVNLSQNETYVLRHDDSDVACLWVFIAAPGRKVQATIRHLDRACKLTFGRGYDSTSPVRQEIIREINVNNYYQYTTNSYPRSITANVSIMWIDIDCGYYYAPTGDVLQVDVRQYTSVDCSSGEYTCPSGLSCIQENALCDGRADCPEYLDEIGCGNCSTSEFSCRSGQDCVSVDSLCNGLNDCPDFSDEFECAPCGDSYIDASSRASTVLISPGWPGREYPRDSQCLWLIVAEVGYRVTLSFLEFFLEESYDYLYCGDGDRFQDSFLTVTGSRFPLSVSSTNNTMFVKFTSDYSVQKSGFQLQFEQKLAPTVSCGEGQIACKADHLICVRNDSSEQGLQLCSQGSCGSRVVYIFGDYADLNSPEYPNPYPSDIACQWEARSKVILVSIMEFSTEPSRDVVRFQGSTLHGGETVAFVLDGSTKVRTIAFNSTSVSISFSTDSTVEDSGFRLRLFKNFSASVNTSCPDPDLFDCGDGSCLSPNAKCDGFKDCQTNGLDELNCEDITCPEFYHCQDSLECIHWPLVCDGTPDCPHQDDETNSQCDQRCPSGCLCDVHEGTVHVNCKHGWNDSTLANLVKRTGHLQLSGANASTLDKGLFKDFSYLKSLLLNNNNMHTIQPGTFFGLTNLTFLDISNNSITSIDANCFLELHSLDVIIATAIPLQVIQEKAFDGLKKVRIMVLIKGSASNDTADATVNVMDGALTDLLSLEKLYVDDYRLCCEFVSSIGFDVSNCITTELQPPLNLCGSLMRNTLLRVAMWVLGLSALIGNAVVIVWRCCQGKEKGGKKTHSFLVLNLAVSDLMMGVYMLMIAVADIYFGEKYSRVANQWRASPVCKIAGVLSVLSSEASVFFVTLISLDSFFCIVFPFSRIRLREKSATITVLVLWMASVGLSIGPTVFVGSDSEIYGLSDVCIGLPLLTKPTSYEIEESDITNPVGTDTIQVPVGKGKQPAWIYSIILFLGVNLLCFLVVLCCYVAIFVKVKRTVSRVRKTAHRDQEIKMAVKMALIVGTDFACWMPVIIMGILSQTGAVDISPDMYAWIVVFILPINSSLNPYMYTFYTVAASRRLAKSTESQKTRFTTEMKTKSLETLHSTISDTKSS